MLYADRSHEIIAQVFAKASWQNKTTLAFQAMFIRSYQHNHIMPLSSTIFHQIPKMGKKRVQRPIYPWTSEDFRPI
jgi:hypothetical protein